MIYIHRFIAVLIFNNYLTQFGLDRSNYFGVNITCVQVCSQIEFKSSTVFDRHT